MITILIADAHHLFRRGLANLVQMSFGDQVELLEAETFDEAYQLLEASDEVDLTICDLDIPNGGGLSAIEKLGRISRSKPVVALAESKEIGVVRQVLACGARGYMLKCARTQHLRLALEMVMAGGTYIPAEVLGDSIARNHSQETALPVQEPDLAAKEPPREVQSVTFTERELAVLQSIMHGDSNKEIARDLDIAESTVKIHVRSICRKSRTRNRTQAALFANDFFRGSETGQQASRGKLINLYEAAGRAAQ